MIVGLAQINSTVGDFAGNRVKIEHYIHRAVQDRCDIVVFPELALFGYPAGDLLERPKIVKEQLAELNRLAKNIPSKISVFVGCVARDQTSGALFNSVALLRKNSRPIFFHKTCLPNYDVFEEKRFFQPGDLKKFVRIGRQKILVTVCEDIWAWSQKENPLKKLPKGDIDLVLNLSGSPYGRTKWTERKKVWQETVKRFRTPLCYVNMVGGQDEILFDGRSVWVDSSGKVQFELKPFAEDYLAVDTSLIAKQPTKKIVEAQKGISTRSLLRQALVMGIRDFVRKSGLERVHLGLSGGIDSAVVVCLAVEALGAAQVTAITLPSHFSDPKSRETAELLAKNLGIHCENIDIWKSYEAIYASFEGVFGAHEFGLVNENIQARVRGILLMAYSNFSNSMLLTTGNKVEYAAGYSTLYGDQCGGLAPLGDLLKSDVYKLAQEFNREQELIPSWIITRPPSAELHEGQVDQDTLPAYDELDQAVVRIVEENKSAVSSTEKWLLEALYRSEFKRWQVPPILKVSRRSFGRGRRYPIANKVRL